MPIIKMPVEELKNQVGKEIGLSEWFEITQDRINDFAECTLDNQWIHVDVERAKNGPFGQTIAHGALVLSLLYHLSKDFAIIPTNVSFSMNYGFDKVRFMNPVPVGSRIRIRASVSDVSDRGGGRYLMKINNVFELEGSDKPACVAEALAMFVK
ncbi:MAG: MaoC family dehydratase [Pseudomonadota bacterium]